MDVDIPRAQGSWAAGGEVEDRQRNVVLVVAVHLLSWSFC